MCEGRLIAILVLTATARVARKKGTGMRKVLNLKSTAGIVTLVALMSLGVSSTAFAGEVAGGKQANSACTLEPQVTKNEPGLCYSQPVNSVVTESVPSTPAGSSLDAVWIALAAAIAAVAATGTAVRFYRHKPHPIV